MSSFVYLIWGADGWIGGMLSKLLREQGHTVIAAKARLQFLSHIHEELRKYKPNFVLNAAGITGRPTVDWCEDNKEITYLTNVIGIGNLAYACSEEGIHLTNYATGCIYTYDGDINRKFSENDPPNFDGSTYSKSKILSEQLLAVYNNVLTLRLRMPISDDLNPKSLIAKLIKYERVVNIPNSVSVLSELLPISLTMGQMGLTGIWNFTNPGVVSHNEILELYKEYVNPNFTWKNFSEEEQNAILRSKRSNCHLDVSKLQNIAEITPIREALIEVMKKIADKG